MPQQNRDEAGALSDPIRKLADAINKLKGMFGTTLTVTGTVTVQEPLSVDDDDSSLTVDAVNTAPLPVAATENGTNTLVKVGDDANKAVRVNVVAGAGSGGTSQTDGAAYTASSTAGTPVMGAVDDTGTTACAEDKVGIARITPQRAIHVNLRDNAGSELAVGGGTQYAEDSGPTATPTGTAQILISDSTPALEVTEGLNVARRGTRYGAAYTQIVSSAGAFVDTFGGGTQYTEGDTDSTITGTAALWEDTSDTLRAISMAKPLPVQPGTAITFPVSAASLPLPAGAATSALQTQPGVDIGDVTVNGVPADPFGLNADAASATGSISAKLRFIASTGIPITGTVAVSGAVTNTVLSVVGNGAAATAQRVTLANDSTGVIATVAAVTAITNALPTGANVIGQVTANAGTNLNTSTLALEAGGNLAGAATSLAIIDDWDESDRAKVNPIVGQAGVQGGAGAVTALTQRVVLATDQTVIPVSTTVTGNATGTASNVGDSASSVTVLASNAARKGATLWNDSTSVAYVKLGATASATSCAVKMRADAYYEVPFNYTGIIDAIWVSDAGGSMRVTEITA